MLDENKAFDCRPGSDIDLAELSRGLEENNVPREVVDLGMIAAAKIHTGRLPPKEIYEDIISICPSTISISEIYPREDGMISFDIHRKDMQGGRLTVTFY